MLKARLKSEFFSTLPPVWPHDPVEDLQRVIEGDPRKIVVLDDDPTGTQTIHDLAVVTDWTVETLERRCFFILTNSRALDFSAAAAFALEIGRNLQTAAKSTGRSFVVISRSDSTLRGHFPAETDALVQGLEEDFHALVLIPFFEAGGRFTIDDIHYVTQGEELVPAGLTQFAADPSFGYRSSHLVGWVMEKTGGAVSAEKIISIGLPCLRQNGPDHITRLLNSVPAGSVIIVNAACQRDLEVFTLGAIQSELKGRRFLYRTAASFVAVRAAISPRDLLSSRDLLGAPDNSAETKTGGLIIVGSHVNTTTAQLAALRQQSRIDFHEIDVEAVLDQTTRAGTIMKSAQKINETLAKGDHLIVSTSRKLISGDSSLSSLEISGRISSALVEITRQLTVRPQWIVAKGGITSSDIAVINAPGSWGKSNLGFRSGSWARKALFPIWFTSFFRAMLGHRKRSRRSHVSLVSRSFVRPRMTGLRLLNYARQ